MPSVLAYNREIRWNRPQTALSYVDKEVQERFRSWERKILSLWEFQDFQVLKITPSSPEEVEVIVERTGFQKNRLKEERITIKQRWVLKEKRWVLVDGF
jgi:hypothetical protein